MNQVIFSYTSLSKIKILNCIKWTALCKNDPSNKIEIFKIITVLCSGKLAEHDKKIIYFHFSKKSSIFTF